jgi:hypothetical protein
MLKYKHVYTAFVYFNYMTKDGGREMQLDIDFVASGEKGAIKTAVAWSENRLPVIRECHQDAFVSCIKVSHKQICYADDNGYIGTRHIGDLFEWKYDTYPPLSKLKL